MLAEALLAALALQITVEGGIVQWQYYGDYPQVRLRQGKLQGRSYQSLKGANYHSFVGIPYARPPVGSLRLQDPVAADEWDGVRDAVACPPRCPQVVGTEIVGSEDCLYLSVFTPEAKAEAGHPVMVYIHGDDYLSGGLDDYPPLPLLNHPVVLVVLQYRLGVLGFLSTEDASLPGNLGLKDQTLALRWVQDNIRDLGGDPDKVTLFGQGSGAQSVHYQILTPYSRGLFSRAILQSGSALCPKYSRGRHHEAAVRVTKEVGCQEHVNLLDCLRGVRFEKLVYAYIDLQLWNGLPYTMVPRVDGDYIPADPAILLSSGSFSKVDLVLGITKHEGALMTATMFSSWSPVNELGTNFKRAGSVSLSFESEIEPGHLAGVSYFYYVGNNLINIKEVANLTQLYTDRYFSVCTDHTAMLHAQHGSKVYFYELDHRALASSTDKFQLFFDSKWVSHGDDLQYLFSGSNGFPYLRTHNDLLTGEIITTLWTNFAKTGKPTTDDSLGFEWEPVTNSSLAHLSLSPSPKMQGDNRTQLRSFWQSLPTRQNTILFPEEVGYFVMEASKSDNQEALRSADTEDTDSGADGEDQKNDNFTEELVNKILSDSLGAEMAEIVGGSAVVVDDIRAETDNGIKNTGSKGRISDPLVKGGIEDLYKDDSKVSSNTDDTRHTVNKDDVNESSNSIKDEDKDEDEDGYSKDLYNKDDRKDLLRKKYYDDIVKEYGPESVRSEGDIKDLIFKHKLKKLEEEQKAVDSNDVFDVGANDLPGGHDSESAQSLAQTELAETPTQREYRVTDAQTEHTGPDAQTEHTDTNIPGENTNTDTQTGHAGAPIEDGSTRQKATDSDFFIVKKMIDYGDMYQILKENEEATRQYNAAVRLNPSMCTFGEDC
ncbi:juvenile hormone esterase-like [Penaeus chinensis]|uniref:juvenile hormone esterase-like n=1 Tax=Penaeus chinensis TaxID=139456 RepID=UPI001FB63BB9|nr:juvenile hormone esterase-like [Penaeus chinensis]